MAARSPSALSAVGRGPRGLRPEAGIRCNVVAGTRHDHLFVPADRATDAMEVLRALQARRAGTRESSGRPPRVRLAADDAWHGALLGRCGNAHSSPASGR
ncbi:MAG: hypothetical protein NW201_06710 [Gemmatimonadales bacterium]|nr:hypothetical protein [Gemmatimonadales bacterium]